MDDAAAKKEALAKAIADINAKASVELYALARAGDLPGFARKIAEHSSLIAERVGKWAFRRTTNDRT